MSATFMRSVVPAVLAGVIASACKSGGDAVTAPPLATVPPPTSPSGTPVGVGANARVGDLVLVNVNANESCTNPIYRASRVTAIGKFAIIVNDTLNPVGFTGPDFARFATRFDSLVYPVDVAAFGAPTDIDANGHVVLVFTRAVNELTPRNSGSYVGGFTFSRDLFPTTATQRAQACAASNVGEYFYLLTPDPTGAINGNVRTTGFVDSVTTGVLAHEFEHLINASRRLYVNNAKSFEVKWLDEGLAHVAEELLFYRESGLVPRSNLDVNAIRASAASVAAYNVDMRGNGDRYRAFLQSPTTHSPFGTDPATQPGDDSLQTRGGIWSLLRYALDRAGASDGFGPGQAQTVTGSGTVTVSAGATAGEYFAVAVNASLQVGSTASYTLTGTGITPLSTVSSRFPVDGPTLARAAVEGAAPAPTRDLAFESRLRERERALAPRASAARAWFAHRGGGPALMSRSSSPGTLVADDNALLLRLGNNTTTGIENLQSVFGGNLAAYVRDWEVSNAVDDIAQLRTEFQQRSWNWHSIFPALGNGKGGYPLQFTPLAADVPASASVVAGGAAFYRFSVPASGSATLTLAAGNSGASTSLQLLIVRTK